VYWTPLIIKGLITNSALSSGAAAGGTARSSLAAVGLSTIPFAVGAAAVILAAAHAQRRQELFLHAAVPLAVSGVITTLFPLMAQASPILGFVSLIITLACALAANPSVSSIIALLHKGPHEVVALPIFDGVMNLGAIVGSPLTGAIIQKTERGFFWVTVVMGLVICLSTCLLLVLGAWVAHGPLAERLFLKPRGAAGRAAAAAAAEAAEAAAAGGEEGARGAPGAGRIVIRVGDDAVGAKS
jgi:MFS family permease